MISPSRYELDIDPETEGYLVLTDSFDPGWTAEIDGKPAVIHVVNGYQQGVKVDTNSRRVVFNYRPAGFYAGGIMSLVSLVALSVWAAIGAYPYLSRRFRSAGNEG